MSTESLRKKQRANAIALGRDARNSRQLGAESRQAAAEGTGGAGQERDARRLQAGSQGRHGQAEPAGQAAAGGAAAGEDAAMESFLSTLKIERIHRKRRATRDEMRADVFYCIERFYNPRRRHSTLGQISPIGFETRYAGLARCP